MPASQAPQPSATPSPTRTRRSQPWSTSKLKITATANTVLFAIAAHADEREAHIREVQRYGETLPEDRAVERAYRIAIDRNVTYRAPESTESHRSSQHAADREIELE